MLQALAVTAVGFASVTIDWWRGNDSHYGPKFGNAGMLTLDLNNKNLRTLAKGLTPAHLRVGGTPADSIIYDANGECQRVNHSFDTPPDCFNNNIYIIIL